MMSDFAMSRFAALPSAPSPACGGGPGWRSFSESNSLKHSPTCDALTGVATSPASVSDKR